MALRQAGATRYLPRAYWSCAVFRSTSDAALIAAGLLRMIAMIAIFPIVYVAVFTWVGRAEALVGLVAGAAHGLLSGLLVSVAARRCSGARPPGFMGWNLGRATPLILLLVHGVYGTALAYVYVIPLP